MNPASSVAVGGDFTLRTAFVGHVRSLSIQHPRQHQGEVPARQGFEACGELQNFRGVGVAHDCIVFFLRAFETATDGNTRQARAIQQTEQLLAQLSALLPALKGAA